MIALDARPEPPRTRPGLRLWPRVAARFRPYRWQVGGVVLLVLVFVALSMVSPLLLREVIDDALPRHDARLLIVFCGAMIVAGALSTGSAVALYMMINWVGQRVVHELRMELYDRVQQMPLDFFASEPTAEIQARMASDIGGISDIITFTAASTLTALVSLVAAGLVMLVLNWPLALTCLVLAVALSLFNRRFDATRRNLAGEQQARMTDLLGRVADDLTLSGIILGRTFIRQASQRSQFGATSAEVRDLTYRQRVAGSTARGVIGLTMACLPPLIYLLAGTAVSGLSVGTIVVIVLLQMRLTGPIQQLLGLTGQLQSVQIMFRRVFGYLDLQPVPGLGGPARDARTGPGGLTGPPVTLQLSDVRHRYPDSERTALAGIDLDISPGSTTVILGHTGCGKSTLALILAGLVTPTAGTVQMADLDRPAPRWLPVNGPDLWREVTLVAQETVMFNTSIRENLLFARPDATDAQLRAVIDAMQLSGLLSQLPAGLDTTVGERGYQLSGGERQRLALARALLSPSRILIADEATSALDNSTAAAVHARLRELCGSQALVIIAHRIPRLDWGDQMIVLSDGRVVHRGTHGELISGCNEYRRLLASQAPLPGSYPADVA